MRKQKYILPDTHPPKKHQLSIMHCSVAIEHYALFSSHRAVFCGTSNISKYCYSKK